jgi:hypothetical protein
MVEEESQEPKKPKKGMNHYLGIDDNIKKSSNGWKSFSDSDLAGKLEDTLYMFQSLVGNLYRFDHTQSRGEDEEYKTKVMEQFQPYIKKFIVKKDQNVLSFAREIPGGGELEGFVFLEPSDDVNEKLESMIEAYKANGANIACQRPVKEPFGFRWTGPYITADRKRRD